MAHDPVPALLARAAERLGEQFTTLPAVESADLWPEQESALARVLDETARRLGDNYPYFHPLYAGQMLKPPHLVARAAYALAMAINPNNHALDGGRASSAMEIEAVSELAAMFGWTAPGYLGHLTSSGTIANLEALWIAGQIAAGEGGNSRILGSEQAHYTHERISAVLKLPFSSVETDARGRLCLDSLEAELRKGEVGTVVVTMGTTAIGAVDPLDQVLVLKQKYGFRIHVDAAYGGYFKLIPDALDEPARRAFAVIDQADSIVVDPHKHGLQPYGCGCVLFRDPGVGRFYKHDSPYTYFTSHELPLHPNEQRPLVGSPVHLGEISLECSRAGAAAVALWATQKLLPPVPGGDFARGLAQGRAAAVELDRRLRADARFEALAAGRPELDIAVWKIAAGSSTEASERARQIFDICAARNLHLALVQLPERWFGPECRLGPETVYVPEAEKVTCLRSVLMKPEHEAWLDRIWNVFSGACNV
jgi:tyrosine decarboxylase / aspartate 1-decarboxylase